MTKSTTTMLTVMKNTHPTCTSASAVAGAKSCAKLSRCPRLHWGWGLIPRRIQNGSLAQCLGLCRSREFQSSDTYGSGPPLWVQVRVRTKWLRSWGSGLSTDRHCPPRYGSMDISQPLWIGQVISGLPRGSICRFIYRFSFCSVIIVS